jgi:hypothetical protein
MQVFYSELMNFHGKKILKICIVMTFNLTSEHSMDGSIKQSIIQEIFELLAIIFECLPAFFGYMA